MRIGIDCRLWNQTGVGRYIRHLIKYLSKLDTTNEYILFVRSEDAGKIHVPSNFKLVEVNIKWHSVKEQVVLPFVFKKQKLDLLHVPYFNVPIFYPGKFVVTIHDLTILKFHTGRASTLIYPLYLIKRLGFRLVLHVGARRAQKIITVSDFVKKDIAKSLKVNKQKIVLTLNALSDGFEKASDNKVRDILSEYGIAQPYIFYVGNAHPHKNLERLLQAFEKVVKSNSNINLVLAGKKYYFYERLEKEWKDSEIFSKIKFAGFVDDIDLPGLYTGASLFVNPSMFEGFGLQLLEAFSCGTKVSCSNTTSLPEVGGEACYYFNPYSTGDMAETILAALKDTSDDKKELGYKQLSKFSWEQLASKTLNCYKQI